MRVCDGSNYGVQCLTPATYSVTIACTGCHMTDDGDVVCDGHMASTHRLVGAGRLVCKTCDAPVVLLALRRLT